MLAGELLLQAKRSAGGLPHYFLLLYEALPDAGLSDRGSGRVCEDGSCAARSSLFGSRLFETEMPQLSLKPIDA